MFGCCKVQPKSINEGLLKIGENRGGGEIQKLKIKFVMNQAPSIGKVDQINPQSHFTSEVFGRPTKLMEKDDEKYYLSITPHAF